MKGETSSDDLGAGFPDEPRTRIKVIGIGGSGIHAVNCMIDANAEGVEYLAADTDARALAASKAPSRIQLGAKFTEGVGSGGSREIGTRAALESGEKITEAGSHDTLWAHIRPTNGDRSIVDLGFWFTLMTLDVLMARVPKMDSELCCFRATTRVALLDLSPTEDKL
jgi:hypothetical protein